MPVLMLARVLDLGGIERDVSKFARHLAEHGIEPHVGCFNPGGVRWKEIEAAGINVVEIPVRSFMSWSAIDAARILQRYIREHRIRVLHAFDIPADVYGVPLALALGVPVAISSQLCYRELSPISMRLLMAVVDRIATGIFVNSEAVADHLTHGWMVERSRIHVCHNGYEPLEFNPSGRKRPAALEDASVVIGTVGLLREEKNPLMLLEAFAKLHRTDRRARLVFVGEGPLRGPLEERIRALDIVEACTLAGAVPNPAEWMRAMDIFVLPSVSESFSNALLEAMACGCCPVASDVGGASEMIEHGATGLLFKLSQPDELSAALQYLARNPQQRGKMAATAASFVSGRLTIQQACTRLAGIYRELLSKSGAGNGVS